MYIYVYVCPERGYGVKGGGVSKSGFQDVGLLS